MPALDFPASPTDGQVYQNWIYSTSKGAWQAKPMVSAKTVTSPVPPSAPTNGDEWFNTNDGNLYVYYTDVDGSQWVQVKSDATLSSTLGNRVTSLETYPSGLVPIVPSSVTVGSGSSSVDSMGNITLTDVSSVSLNGVFSSAYKSYRVLFNEITPSVGGVLVAGKMRASGADSTSGYDFHGARQFAANAVGQYDGASATSWSLGNYTSRSSMSIDIHSPALPIWTTGNVLATQWVSGVGWGGSFSGLMHGASTAYDGITFALGSGTTSGSIKVYGYR